MFVRYGSQGIDALDEVERFRFWNWHIIQLYVLDSQHYQHKLGMLDDETWQDTVRRIQRQLPIWDDLNMRGIGRASFIDEVNRLREEPRVLND